MHGLMMEYPLTIDRIIEHANRLFANKQIRTKQVDGRVHEYTYGDLYRRSRRLASALVKRGIKTGDRVATFAWNHYQHLEMYFGIPGAGAVCHTLNVRLSPRQLAYIASHAEDRIVFVDATVLPLFEPIARQLECVEQLVLVNAQNEGSMYLHTLGANQAMALGLTENDVVMPVVPQFHAMAWGLPYACPLAGADVVMPGPDLRPSILADLIESYQITVAAGVPSIWNGLYHELKENRRDVSSLRALVVGGSAMPRALIEAYEQDLGVNVVHAWGMTELSPLGTVSRLHRQHLMLGKAERWDVKARQGVPLGGVELRIVGDAGTPLPWDGKTMGELQARGPWVIKSYFKHEPTPQHFTPDGWFRTGDVATMTSDGFLTITDRTKDLVKSGGEWISTVALEGELMAHDHVLEAAVIAVPDEKWSERPLAVVVPIKAGEVTEGDLRHYLLKRFAKFEVPEKFIFVEELPKTSVGKFDKKLLRARYAEKKLQSGEIHT